MLSWLLSIAKSGGGVPPLRSTLPITLNQLVLGELSAHSSDLCRGRDGWIRKGIQSSRNFLLDSISWAWFGDTQGCLQPTRNHKSYALIRFSRSFSRRFTAMWCHGRRHAEPGFWSGLHCSLRDLEQVTCLGLSFLICIMRRLDLFVFKSPSSSDSL